MKVVPNTARYWSKCPAIPYMARRFPTEPGDPLTDGRWEGRAVAKMAELVTCKGVKFGVGDTVPTIPEEIKVTRQMLTTVAGYIKNLRPLFEGSTACGVEDEFYCYITGSKARPDAWAISPSGRLTVVELKNGVVPVEAERNPQGICYLLAILSGAEADYGITGCSFVVYQPNAYNVRTRGQADIWETTPTQVNELSGSLEVAAASAKTDSPYAVPGRHCRKCLGAHSCERFLQAEVYEALETEHHISIKEPTPAQTGFELKELDRAIKILTARRTAVEQLALSRKRAIPGFEFTSGVPGLAWKKDVKPESIKLLGVFHGVAVEKPGLITPKQAIAAGVPEEEVRKYAEETEGTVQLKPVDMKTVNKRFKNAKPK